MKFCNLVRETSENIPEIRNLFESYKRLKKTLKGIDLIADANVSNERENLFLNDLRSTISNINEQFMEKEESFVIEMARLEELAANADTAYKCNQVTKQVLEFHGKVLLFIHSAMMEYTAVLKILKKYSKKTGRETMSRNEVMKMPVCSTEIAASIVDRADASIEALIDRQSRFNNQSEEIYQEVSADNRMEQVRVALQTWETLKNTAATPSTIITNFLNQVDVNSVASSFSISGTSSAKSEALSHF